MERLDGKPFFCWLSPTRMHIVTHLPSGDKWATSHDDEHYVHAIAL